MFNRREQWLIAAVLALVLPVAACYSSKEGAARSALENTRWVPIRIGDRDVTVAEGQQEPWLELDPHTHRVTGSGGCNRINGGYEAGNQTLRFSGMASTRMACPALDTETAFLKGLDDTRRYRVEGRTLELQDDAGRVLARLEERNLR